VGLENCCTGRPAKSTWRAFSQFTSPPESDGDQQLWFEYRTDQTFTKNRIATPTGRGCDVSADSHNRDGDDRFPNNAQSFDDLQGRDPWEFSWKLIGTDVLYSTVRFPNTRPS